MDSQRTDPIEERFFDIRQAADLLEVSEEELWDLVHQHKIPTHNIAGAFLRFKKEDIEQLKIKWRIERELFPRNTQYFDHKSTVGKTTIFERIADFWYFNDYYIFCALATAALLYFIISSQ